MAISARISGRNSTKSSTASSLPATLVGSGGITVDKAGNVTTIGFDIDSIELGAELQQAIDASTAQAEAAADSATAAAGSASDAADSAAEAAANALDFPWIDAREYGVTGDVADDQTTALTDAWAAAAVAGGKLVLPAGTIKLDTTSLVDLVGSIAYPIEMMGQGRGVTTLYLPNANSLGIRVSQNPNGMLRDFSISTDAEQTTGALLTIGDTNPSTTIYQMRVDNLGLSGGFRGLWIRAATSVAVSNIYAITGADFSDVTYKVGSSLIEVNSEFGPVSITGAHITSNRKAEFGVLLTNCDYCILDHCHFSEIYNADIALIPSTAVAHVSIRNCDVDDDVPANVATVFINSNGTKTLDDVQIIGSRFRTAGGGTSILLAAPELHTFKEFGNVYPNTGAKISIQDAGSNMSIDGRTLIEVKTTTSGTSVVFSKIPPNAKLLQFVGGGISCDTASRELWLQVSTDGGSSWRTTGGDYAGYNILNTTLGALSSSTSLIKSDATNTAAQSNTIDLLIDFQAGLQPKCRGHIETTAGGRYYQNTNYAANSNVVNAFRFVWSASGNFDAGSINLYSIE